MSNNVRVLKILSCLLSLLLLVSVFKNISYPLFWADESFTAMGSERVIEYGYPKAHDGKNVLNDMWSFTTAKAVNERDDAYIGGASWGQYYYGVIGYLLSAKTDNLYSKTGIYRSSFAIIGLAGLLLLAISMSNFFEDTFYKYLFIALFLLAELISVSLVLHLRQVRYYPLALFFVISLISLYSVYRFQRQKLKILYSVLLSVLLWLTFTVFSPIYFVFLLSIGISELVLVVFKHFKDGNLKAAIVPCLPTIVGILVSFIGVFPLLEYFKTFEMKKLLDDYYGFNFSKYWYSLSIEMRYFSKFELLWLAVAMRTLVLINFKKTIKTNSKLFKVSNFLTLLFIVAVFLIPDTDTGIFTRYYIYMQPVLACIALLDFIFLLSLFSGVSKKIKGKRVYLLIGVVTLFFGYTFAKNLPFISGHIYEMTHQYKGPLDYTIPYIKSNYDKPEDLIIATNYEETSYMYYLHCKVIVGYVGNNLQEDTLYQPRIISYRQSKGSPFENVFYQFTVKAAYRKIDFPGKDIPLNNTPELNFERPAYNHYFKSVFAENNNEDVSIYIKM